MDFYSIRHGHGTAPAAGVQEKDIAASMHHANRQTTARYLHTDTLSRTGTIEALPTLAYPLAAKEAAEVLRTCCATGATLVDSGGQTDMTGGAAQLGGFRQMRVFRRKTGIPST